MAVLGVFIKEGDKRVLDYAGDLIRDLAIRKHTILVLKDQAGLLKGVPASPRIISSFKKASFLLAVGGDGTMLRSARLFSSLDLPILGINLGRRGFLTEVGIEEVLEVLPKIIAGGYFLDRRMMLDVKVKREKKTISSSLALNDAVIGKNGIARLIRLEAWHNGNLVTTYGSDGLIVSTPTGSTGHNLSAGGPILDSSLKSLILTAICSTSISNRSIVIDSKGALKIKVVSVPKGMDGTLTLDGQTVIKLGTGDEVLITRADSMTKFVRLKHRNFFSVLKGKLGWEG
ncbi:MAG: NAD(+)/NADH kinase [Candidatus Margulisiibacteriota bacterium]